MKRHLEVDELVLHYYREGDTVRAEVHLGDCAECRDAFGQLERELGLADGLRVPARSEGYADEVWERLSARLADAPFEAAPSSSPSWGARIAGRIERFRAGYWAWVTSGRTLALGGSLAALLVLVFWLGYDAGGGGAAPIPPQVRERILLVAVGDHLERSQRLLIELAHAEPDGEYDLSTQRAAAERLADQNRLYRQTALKGDTEPIGELLDELERLLVEIANGPDKLARNELSQLQRRIERRGILFKIRVIGNDVRQQDAAAPPQV